MGLFKSLVERMRDKKDELQKKAAKKVAEVAMDQTAKAAKGALGSAGRAIEKAVFGDKDEAIAVDDRSSEDKPDPFAKLKKAEAAKKERQREEQRQAKERADREGQLEKDVDTELAALKKRLGK